MNCIHCGSAIRKKDKDHLFPKSWYPETTSERVQRWTIPSCIPCNRAFGEIEEEMLITMGLAVEPSHYASLGINQRAINALDPSRARNDRDRAAREAMMRRVRERLVHNVSEMSAGVIPNLARSENLNTQGQNGLFIPDEYFTSLCRKFVKGITWVAHRQLINEDEYTINSFPMKPDNLILQQAVHWTDYSRAPGLIIKRVISEGDPTSSINVIIIWQQYLFYASCIRNDLRSQHMQSLRV